MFMNFMYKNRKYIFYYQRGSLEITKLESGRRI